jgi:hypothetical protein
MAKPEVSFLGPRFTEARTRYYQEVGDLAANYLEDGTNTPENCAEAAVQEVLKRRRVRAEGRRQNAKNIYDIRNYTAKR